MRALLAGAASLSLMFGMSVYSAAPGAAAEAQAPSNSADAQKPIETLYAALTKAEAPNSGAPKARASLIAPAIDQAFDLETILRNSIGLHYASLSTDDKQKLLAAFRSYTVARYVNNFKPGAGAKFTIAPQTRPSPLGNGVIVDTTIAGDNGSGTPVDYVMATTAQGYRVVDVLLNAHVSQVATQRSDFSSTLASGGADALISLMDRKTKSFMSE